MGRTFKELLLDIFTNGLKLDLKKYDPKIVDRYRATLDNFPCQTQKIINGFSD